jgi:regulatory protein
MEGQITAIQAGNKPGVRRARIYLDGRLAFSLDEAVIVKNNLKIGQMLSVGEVEILTGLDRREACLNAALNFLSFRPRSEAETRIRLRRRGFGDAEIEPAITHLKETRLLDDTAFAEFWKENRDNFRPRSQRVLKQELRQKGLDGEVIDQVIDRNSEAENAYRVASQQSRKLAVADYFQFYRRLGGYLQRRGFSGDVIHATLKKIWEEKKDAGGQPE